jgi:hypothetical protein
MTKSADTHEHQVHDPKQSGCCGGSHTREVPPAAQEQAKIPKDAKREHTHHADSSSCCCGSGKKATSQPNRGE